MSDRKIDDKDLEGVAGGAGGPEPTPSKSSIDPELGGGEGGGHTDLETEGGSGSGLTEPG